MHQPKTINECKELFIKNNIKTNKNANATVLQFISDFLYKGRDINDALVHAQILSKQFRSGYCYYFAHMLKTAFQDGEVCWAAPFGHIIWQYKNIEYDIEGVYTGETKMFIPESFMNDTINDFKHIPNIIHNTSEQEIATIIENWKEQQTIK